MSENIREIALDSMIEIMENNQFIHVVTAGVLAKHQYLDKTNRAFYSRLVQGTCENIIYIDYITDHFSKVKVKKMKPLIRNNIRLAVYQIIFMDSVPDSAACNEAVKLAGKRGFRGLAGFVNGVLRSIAKGYQGVALPDKNKDELQYLSVKYSVPQWIVKMWSDSMDKEKVYAMLKACNKKSDLVVRVCASPDNLEEEYNKVAKQLEDEGVHVMPGKYLKEAMILKDVDYLGRLTAFNEGKIYIQDESSMLVAHAAGIKGDEFCMDICAAPGGKTLHTAMMLDKGGKIIARDVSDDKVARINDNVIRCGCSNVEAQVFDATVHDDNMEGKADIVFADVPCSGLGVIGHKPDIRYKTKEEDIESLVKLQREILENAVTYVKPGGVLIYSTCTVNDYENIGNVRWLTEKCGLEPESLEPYIPKCLCNETTSKGYLTLVPGINDCDGFFIARFRKRNED